MIIDEIDWNPAPVLLPGFDFKDGVVYITIPMTRNKLIPPKSKNGQPKIERMLDMLTITSEREQFWFDKEGIEEAGFTPPHHAFQERESRWSYPSARAFVENRSTTPDTVALYNRLHKVYTTYVEFANEHYFTIMPLFVLYTYVFRLFDTTGYLHFNGTAASGKSRNLNILNALAFNAMMASSMSASSLFRKIAGSPGTMCLDESENFEGERGADLRQILLGGYMRSGVATRSEKQTGDKWESVSYPTFGPKALASINTLDSTFASRCLVIEMRPAVREIPDFPMMSDEWQSIRDDIYLWMMANTAAIDALSTEWNGAKKAKYAPTLISRSWEITKPLIVLADFVGGEAMFVPLIEFFKEYFAKQQVALDATDRLRTTLRALPRVLATKSPHPGSYYAVKDIHDVISMYMEEDTKEFFKTRHVTKNLDVLGFKDKRRASGGVQVRLTEDEVRSEFTQRRVQPFEEDEDWLRGERSYQHASTIPSVWENEAEFSLFGD